MNMPNPADNPKFVQLIKKIQTENDPIKVTEIAEQMCRVLDEEEAAQKRTTNRSSS
jgi:hypothetical protein